MALFLTTPQLVKFFFSTSRFQPLFWCARMSVLGNDSHYANEKYSKDKEVVVSLKVGFHFAAALGLDMQLFLHLLLAPRIVFPALGVEFRR